MRALRLVCGSWMLASLAALVAAPVHAGDAARGKDLSYTCLGCHGVESYENVNPIYRVPKLNGQHPEYLIAALKAYRSGERSHATMHQQAVSLSDADIEDIATYFAGTVLPASATAVGTAPAKVGQVCGACHGLNGIGITGTYPTLAGQHADYLRRALEEYRHGDRKNPIMPNFAQSLSESEIEQIADYYAHQNPPLLTEPRPATRWSAR